LRRIEVGPNRAAAQAAAIDRLRRRQIGGLLILLAIIVAASIWHAGFGQVFPAGWWRIW
jgi:hypothetical protein